MQSILLTIVSFLLFFSLNSNAGEAVDKNKLAKCPDSPNCVCSLDEEGEHKINPIAFGGVDVSVTHELMLKVIKQMPRTNIIEHEGNYLHVTFTSLVFRFIDDVELLWDETQGVIHIRSASRVGYSDFGVNRRRVEDIRQQYKEQLQLLLRSGA